MKKTNFDRYLEEQLKQPAFAERFERAGEAWTQPYRWRHFVKRRAFRKESSRAE